jgi:hypothetical protein
MRKNNTLLLILLFIFKMSEAQYVYFNQNYPGVDGASAHSKVFEQDNYYLSFGGVLFTIGFEYRKVTYDGNNLENQIIETSSYQPNYAAIADQTYIQTPLGFVTSAVTQDNSCSPLTYAAGCQLFNEDFEQLWISTFPEWSVCDSVTNSNIGYTIFDDTSFVMLSYFAHQNGQSFEPDSMGWRITRINHYNGQAYESYRYVTPYFAFSPKQIIFSEGYYFVSGYYIPFQGTTSNPSDRQMMVYKISAEGEIVGEMSLGNPDACYETEPYMLEMHDGKIAFFYEYCLDQFLTFTQAQSFNHMEPRLAIIDPNTFECTDYTLTLPDMELWTLGLANLCALQDNQNNLLINQQIYYYQGEEPDLAMPEPHYTIITKLTPEGEIIWQNEYLPSVTPDDPYLPVAIYDMIQTTDGGYLGTGQAFDQQTQLHWLLKLDNCGYEQPSGCPAVVSTNEHETENNTIQLWPNPCHNVLKGIIPTDAVAVRFIDQTGRVVMEEKVYYPNQQWDVSWLECGVYVLEVELADKRRTSAKLIRQ